MTTTLCFIVEFEDNPLSLAFFARDEDPGIIHAFAPLGRGTIRGMTTEESRLVDHPDAQEVLDKLAEEANRSWHSWSLVETLIIVHNVIDPPERETPEA